jgi:hypothetical protein
MVIGIFPGRAGTRPGSFKLLQIKKRYRFPAVKDMIKEFHRMNHFLVCLTAKPVCHAVKVEKMEVPNHDEVVKSQKTSLSLEGRGSG